MPRMRKFALIITMLAAGGMTSGCIGLPDIHHLFYPVNDNSKPDYARGGNGNPSAPAREPLDVPPSLRNQVTVPMPDQVAVDAAHTGKMSKLEKQAIAGNAVSLDAHEYDVNAAEVFSTVIDAMTSINVPVESVDSPSGTITTGWVRQNVGGGGYFNAALNVFGAGGPSAVRYRYIARIYRTKSGKTLLQVRTLGQEFVGNRWVFKALKRKVANDLFSAVDERLAAKKGQPETSPVMPTSGGATIQPPASSNAKP